MENIILNGCSFIAGHSVSKNTTLGYHLKTLSGVEPINLALHGGGNERIFANNGDGYGNPYSSSNGHRFNHNDWKNYVFTFDGGTARYWRDGTDYGTCPTYRSWNGYNGSWSIGTWTGPYFGTYAISNGRWKKFAAWYNTVLTNSQISELYNNGHG